MPVYYVSALTFIKWWGYGRNSRAGFQSAVMYFSQSAFDWTKKPKALGLQGHWVWTLLLDIFCFVWFALLVISYGLWTFISIVPFDTANVCQEKQKPNMKQWDQSCICFLVADKTSSPSHLSVWSADTNLWNFWWCSWSLISVIYQLGLSGVKEEGHYYWVYYNVSRSIEDLDIYLGSALRGVGIILTLKLWVENSDDLHFATFFSVKWPEVHTHSFCEIGSWPCQWDFYLRNENTFVPRANRPHNKFHVQNCMLGSTKGKRY